MWFGLHSISTPAVLVCQWAVHLPSEGAIAISASARHQQAISADAQRWFCRHEKIDFWDNVYGFDFSAIKQLAMQEPLVDVVDEEQVVTEACKLSTFNISDMTKSDAAFTVSPHSHDCVLSIFPLGRECLQDAPMAAPPMLLNAVHSWTAALMMMDTLMSELCQLGQRLYGDHTLQNDQTDRVPCSDW